MIDVVWIAVAIIGGFVVIVALSFIAVGIWVGILEEMKWRPGEPLYYLMDKIIDFSRRVVRRLKNKNNSESRS